MEYYKVQRNWFVFFCVGAVYNACFLAAAVNDGSSILVVLFTACLILDLYWAIDSFIEWQDTKP